MSPWASIHTSPRGSEDDCRIHSALAATDPAARLWSPPSTRGTASAFERLQGDITQLLTDLGDVAHVFLALVGRTLRFRIRRGQVSFVYDRTAKRGDLIPDSCDAKRRRPHVNTTPPGPEVERHANDMDRLHWDRFAARSASRVLVVARISGPRRAQRAQE